MEFITIFHGSVTCDALWMYLWQNIWVSHCGEYVDVRVMGCNASRWRQHVLPKGLYLRTNQHGEENPSEDKHRHVSLILMPVIYKTSQDIEDLLTDSESLLFFFPFEKEEMFIHNEYTRKSFSNSVYFFLGGNVNDISCSTGIISRVT